MSVMTLEEAFLLNPRVTLRKGSIAPKVEMSALKPFTRDVAADSVAAYSGGAKFIDGDVLMARITPSLENGKTSIYRATSDHASDPAFGSTEFVVVRGRDGISDSEYAYYVFTSPAVRDHAISSMNGSSGRQRVQQAALAQFEIDLPSLPEQKRIAAVLGALDDKIASNDTQRSLLRQFGQAKYEALLAEDGETVTTLATLTKSISRGVSPRYSGEAEDSVVVLNQKCIRDGWVSLGPSRKMRDRHVPPAKKAEPGDILVNSTGTGTLGRIGRWHQGSIFVDSHISVVRPEPMIAPPTLLAYALLGREAEVEALAVGSTGQTELSPERLGSVQVRLPRGEALKDLESQLLAIEERADQLARENSRLAEVRGALLPELLSGRVRCGDAAAG